MKLLFVFVLLCLCHIAQARECKPHLTIYLKQEGCPWSEKLYREVVSSKEFLSLLEPHMDVHILFTEGSKETPNFVLLDKQGLPIHEVGFLPLASDHYAQYFLDLLDPYYKIDRILSDGSLKRLSEQEVEDLYKTARLHGFKRYQKEIFDFGIHHMESLFFLLEAYEETLSHLKRKDPKVLALKQKIQSKDPKNRKGAHLRIAMTDFRVNVQRMKAHESPHDVVEPLLQYMKTFGSSDEENAWRIEMIISQFFFSRHRIKSAIRHAEESCCRAPKIVQAEVEQTLQFLQQYKDEHQEKEG